MAAHPLLAGHVTRARALGSFGAEWQTRPEDLVRQPLTGQTGAGEQHLVVLGPEGHFRGHLVFVDRLFDRLLDLRGVCAGPFASAFRAAYRPTTFPRSSSLNAPLTKKDRRPSA